MAVQKPRFGALTIVPSSKEDYKEADAIYDRCHKHKAWSPPRIRHLLAQDKVVDREGNIVAFGALTLFAEGALILDTDRNLTYQAKAVSMLVEEAIEKTKKAGIERLFLFADTPEYADILRKHFGAQTCTGEALVIYLGD